jgi:hypothetical protein
MNDPSCSANMNEIGCSNQTACHQCHHIQADLLKQNRVQYQALRASIHTNHPSNINHQPLPLSSMTSTNQASYHSGHLYQALLKHQSFMASTNSLEYRSFRASTRHPSSINHSWHLYASPIKDQSFMAFTNSHEYQTFRALASIKPALK